MKKIAMLISVFLSVSAVQAEQSIDDLVETSKIIATKIELAKYAATGAVDYMYQGKVIPDYTAVEGKYLISEAEVQAYNEAILGVQNAMYFTSVMALESKAEESIIAVKVAVDSLVVATTRLKEVEEVAVKAEKARDSGSVEDQTAVQEYLETNNVSIKQETVDDFNQSLSDIAVNAREAGAFLAASKDVRITETADRHAKEFNVSFENAQVTYSATKDILEFTWEQAYANHGFHGFMTNVTADQVLSNGEMLYADQGWIMR
jgi:hypothetical protein